MVGLCSGRVQGRRIILLYLYFISSCLRGTNFFFAFTWENSRVQPLLLALLTWSKLPKNPLQTSFGLYYNDHLQSSAKDSHTLAAMSAAMTAPMAGDETRVILATPWTEDKMALLLTHKCHGWMGATHSTKQGKARESMQ
jgi:hypothetical protein